MRFLLSKGLPLDVAEEAAQPAWTRGWERIDQLRDEEFLRTWVNAFALNMYRHLARVDGRKQPVHDRTGEDNLNTAAIDLARLLKFCSASDRRLLLHQMYGLTTTEIAREVDASEAAVPIRLMRALRPRPVPI